MGQDISPIRLLLRLIAFFGTAAVVLWQFVSMPQLQPRQAYGFVIPAVAIFAVVLMLAVMSDATQRLLQYTDLLVPLGLFVTVSTAFNMLAAVPAIAAMLTAPWSIQLLTLSLSLSVLMVATSLLSVVYVGWTTTLILQVVVHGQVNLIAPFAIVGRWFWRTLTWEFLGWSILLCVSAVLLVAGTVSLTVALVLLGVTTLTWNLLTAAVLPVVLADNGPFWNAVKDGLRISREGIPKWAPLVIAQMLLLGWVTFVHVSYTTHETTQTDSGYNLTTTEKTTNKTQTNWSVNSFWTGGYADDCKWHESLMKALESEPLQFVNRLLTLLFAVLAIAIKIKIVSDLYSPSPRYEVLSLNRDPPGPYHL